MSFLRCCTRRPDGLLWRKPVHRPVGPRENCACGGQPAIKLLVVRMGRESKDGSCLASPQHPKIISIQQTSPLRFNLTARYSPSVAPQWMTSESSQLTAPGTPSLALNTPPHSFLFRKDYGEVAHKVSRVEGRHAGSEHRDYLNQVL